MVGTNNFKSNSSAVYKLEVNISLSVKQVQQKYFLPSRTHVHTHARTRTRTHTHTHKEQQTKPTAAVDPHAALLAMIVPLLFPKTFSSILWNVWKKRSEITSATIWNVISSTSLGFKLTRTYIWLSQHHYSHNKKTAILRGLCPNCMPTQRSVCPLPKP